MYYKLLAVCFNCVSAAETYCAMELDRSFSNTSSYFAKLQVWIMIEVYLVLRTLQINCNPTFIHDDFILRLTWDELVCGNLFSRPNLIHILFVITIIRQGLACGKKYLRWQKSHEDRKKYHAHVQYAQKTVTFSGLKTLM